MVSLAFMKPLILSSVVLVATKIVLVGIFPDAPVDEDKAQDLHQCLYHKCDNRTAVNQTGDDLFYYYIYDTIFGWLTFALFSAVLYVPWSDWISGGRDGTFPYSRFMIVHLILAILIFVLLIVFPYTETHFKLSFGDDLFVSAKRPSLVIGWLAILAVEFFGTGPSHWTSKVSAVVLALNVLEAAVLAFKERQLCSGVVLFVITPFTPMMYIDREKNMMTSTNNFQEYFPFIYNFCPSIYNFFGKKFGFPVLLRWWYRLYCLALLSFGLLNVYFATYGLSVPLTLCLPLLTAEIKSFHEEPEHRFEKYTEIFFLLRVSVLWINTMLVIGIREVWFSYYDSSYTRRFSFVIENVLIRNGIEFVFLAGSILLLIHRDKEEGTRRHRFVRF